MSTSLRLAIIVNPELSLGLIANTASALGIGLAAKFPQLAASQLSDTQGRTLDVSSKLPVPILQASAEQMRELLLKALTSEAEKAVVPFPAFARAMHSFEEYEQAFPQRDLATETLDGLALCGPEKWVKSLTGALKLLR
ncbi:DUF2000 domain-containing protein [Ewingella americana]|uniref:DUF2000 domain-containing protein n=1 Tax=Ewingella americana TaxID=41202 RepID=A0A502GGR7_9GAMM|nr:DUF2000 domain-containing protein [Ewingella americana]TPG60768.1 DUF2000 domain-containing protein [Ewingella americana]